MEDRLDAVSSATPAIRTLQYGHCGARRLSMKEDSSWLRWWKPIRWVHLTVFDQRAYDSLVPGAAQERLHNVTAGAQDAEDSPTVSFREIAPLQLLRRRLTFGHTLDVHREEER